MTAHIINCCIIYVNKICCTQSMVRETSSNSQCIALLIPQLYYIAVVRRRTIICSFVLKLT